MNIVSLHQSRRVCVTYRVLAEPRRTHTQNRPPFSVCSLEKIFPDGLHRTRKDGARDLYVLRVLCNVPCLQVLPNHLFLLDLIDLIDFVVLVPVFHLVLVRGANH